MPKYVVFLSHLKCYIVINVIFDQADCGVSNDEPDQLQAARGK